MADDKLNTTKYVLDASMGWPPCFCPVELDEQGEIVSIITGINLITDRPSGPVIAIVHEEGQEAVDNFCTEHADFIKGLHE